MPTKSRIRRWCKEAEARTLAARPSGVAAARHAFRALDESRRFDLSREIVETREAELCLAYRNVVEVAFGYRKKRDRAGIAKVRREVCVIFIVREKWEGDSGDYEPQRLPRELFTYAALNGQRVLFAVPTDVESANDSAAARPGSARREPVNVSQAEVPHGETATLACALRRSEKPGRTFALSCRHALSLSLARNSRLATGLKVRVRTASGAIVGRSIAVRGPLRAEHEGLSFDAQLLEVSDARALAEVFDGVTFDGPDAYAKRFSDIPADYYVLVSRPQYSGNRNDRSAAVPLRKYKIRTNFGLRYGGRVGGTVVHEVVIESAATASDLGPFLGDSGSPVTTRRNGGVLLGMHFGGMAGGGVSYMLPAWRLLNPLYYGRAGERMWSIAGPWPQAAAATARSRILAIKPEPFVRGRFPLNQASPKQRAARFREGLIRPVLQHLGRYSDEAERLLLGTAIRESELRHRRQLGGGPARGLFQMEPTTHDDIWSNFLVARSRRALAKRIHDTMSSADADPIAELENNDAYACAMARAHYLRISDPIPVTGGVRALARYWKLHYNTPLGRGTAADFERNWRRFVS